MKMGGPLLPLMALGGIGLLAHLSMRSKASASAPPMPSAAPSPMALPSPSPVPSQLIDPWAEQPPWPPAPIAAPTPTPAASDPIARADLPPGPVVPVPMPSAPTRDPAVLRDVDEILKAQTATAPAPAPGPSRSTATPLPVLPHVVAPPPLPVPPLVAPSPAPVVQPSATRITYATTEPTTAQPQPPEGFNPQAAKAQAARVAANLRKGRDQYSRPALTAWQRLAGIAADGIYGGGSAGALAWFLQGQSAIAPRPFFKPTVPAPYPWESQAQASLRVA